MRENTHVDQNIPSLLKAWAAALNMARFFFLKGPYLRTTESKAGRLGTYTCIYKELPCDFYAYLN